MEIRIGIAKFIFFRNTSGEINPNKTKTRQQTRKSETKTGGMSVEHRGVSVWNVRGEINPNKPKPRRQTQNSETKNCEVSVEHRRVCVCVCARVCVCVRACVRAIQKA